MSDELDNDGDDDNRSTTAQNIFENQFKQSSGASAATLPLNDGSMAAGEGCFAAGKETTMNMSQCTPKEEKKEKTTSEGDNEYDQREIPDMPDDIQEDEAIREVKPSSHDDDDDQLLVIFD